MYQCQWCGYSSSTLDDFEFDKVHQDGFWCPDCDGHTYLDRHQENIFQVLLEEKGKEHIVSSLDCPKFNHRLSPLRYPGGKSKFIEALYQRFRSSHLATFVEPFAGGASVGLALLDANVVDMLVLNDLDSGIYSLFYFILNDPYALIQKILFEVPETVEDCFRYQAIIKSNYANVGSLEAAYACLVVNRCAYSGIYKANPLGGKDGTRAQLLSRFNRKSLVKRILQIHRMRSRIRLFHEDACSIIEEYYWHSQTTIFLDPPYVEKGKDLYRYFYENEQHEELASLLTELFKGFPGADILVTYDHVPFLREFYWNADIEVVRRQYSI